MNIHDIYRAICGFLPLPEQQTVFDILTDFEINKNPLLLRLPCGYGKTEAVIVPYLHQALSHNWSLAPRLIYVLPTRALCNQIHDRITTYAAKVETISKQKIVVGIEHGTSSLDPLFFSDICITTFDQFLYGYARSKPQVGRHFDAPAGAMAHSLVVFDEAHLYSPYTHSLMRAMLEILRTSRVPVVVMTATMPRTLQDDLLGGSGNYQSIEFSGKWPEFMANRSVAWATLDHGLFDGDTLSDSVSEILEKSSGKSVLVVVNRIDTAQKLARVLGDRDDFLDLIHSRFTVRDRASKEKDVCDYFGKDINKRRAGIVISTQVCEAGLDISCDVLITECPAADALVQRAGRVARWGGNGRVFVFRPMLDDNPIGDGEWDKAFPYVDKTLLDQDSTLGDLKQGELTGITWEYLKQGTNLKGLFTDWLCTVDFCNSMNYHCNDIEARGALGQLFEATLYADDRPWNLSARGDMYCTLAVAEYSQLVEKAGSNNEARKKGKGGARKKNNAPFIPFQDLKEHLINVPFRYLLSKETKGLRQYDFAESRIADELGKTRVRPFQTYLIEPAEGVYGDRLGLILAKQEKADDTEEAASCMIF